MNALFVSSGASLHGCIVCNGGLATHMQRTQQHVHQYAMHQSINQSISLPHTPDSWSDGWAVVQ